MLCNFGVTSGEETKFSSSLQRLASCVSSRVCTLVTAGVAALLLPATARAIPFVPGPEAVLSYCSTFIGFGCRDTVHVGFQSVIAELGHISGDVFDNEIRVMAVGTAFTFRRVDANLTFYFAANGPPADIIIPWLITFRVNTSAVGSPPGFAAGQASLQVTSNFDTLVGRSLLSTTADPPGREDFSGTEMFDMHFDSVGRVEMKVHATTTALGGVGRAKVDPFIFIDPDFLSANPGYSVIVSAGINNALPVPEPSTWILFASGLFVVGRLALRRAMR